MMGGGGGAGGIRSRLRDVTPLIKKRNTNKREYIDKITNYRVEYHPTKQDQTKGRNAWVNKDHYHVENPNSKGKRDYYLDKNGNPVPDKGKRSHLTPDEFENLMNNLGGQK